MKTISLILLGLLFVALTLVAGSWNDKPVMKKKKKEIEKVLEMKGEKLIFAGKQLAKVRTDTGLAKRPVSIPFRLYVNKKTGTFTVLEYHSSYESFCVIAYGVEFQDLRQLL